MGAAAAALALALCTPVFAATGGAVPNFEVHAGTVQNIDYLHHAITINGQTYAVAPDATFSGIAGFSVLHIGMPISYSINKLHPLPLTPPSSITAPDDSPSVITQITWLPGGA